MVDEEYDSHKCLPRFKGLKTIKIARLFIIKDDQNRTIIEARGLDGITYELIQIPENREFDKIPVDLNP